MDRTIAVATGNNGKFAEIKGFLSKHYPNIKVEQCPLDLVEPQSLDLKEVATAKARAAWQILKRPVMVDDGGFLLV